MVAEERSFVVQGGQSSPQRPSESKVRKMQQAAFREAFITIRTDRQAAKTRLQGEAEVEAQKLRAMYRGSDHSSPRRASARS